MRLTRAAKYVWALPTTAAGLGLVCLALVSGGKVRCVDGVLEASGGVVRWLLLHCVPVKGGASAMTFGHVVIGLDTAALTRARGHERAHVRQAERWGPLFIPAYLLASAWQWLRGRQAYHDNPFEVWARREESSC
jgi:hypothetical protein